MTKLHYDDNVTPCLVVSRLHEAFTLYLCLWPLTLTFDFDLDLCSLSISPGAVNATACPPGTIRNALGGADLSDCYPCPAGKYCDLPGQSAPAGECEPRYYCPDFAYNTDPQPTNFSCPPGFYCLTNTGVPHACDPGTNQMKRVMSHFKRRPISFCVFYTWI